MKDTSEILQVIGGVNNIDVISYCSTRLRIEVKDFTLIDEKKNIDCKIIRPTKTNIQIVVNNPQEFYDDIIKLIESSKIKINAVGKKVEEKKMAKIIFDCVGKEENIEEVDKCASKLRLVLRDMEMLDEVKIMKKAGVAGIIKLANNRVQIVIGSEINEVYEEFIKLI